MTGRDRGFRLQRLRADTEEWHREAMTADDGRTARLLSNWPNTGKSYGFHKVAADLDEPATLLQPNRALRADTREAAEDDHGMDAADLPSFPEESPLMDEGSEWYCERAEAWYGRGMRPREIMEALEDPLVPPIADDPYQQKMDGDLTENGLLTGDPIHSFLRRATEARHVAMDDIDPYGSFVDETDLTAESTRMRVREYLEHYGHEAADLPWSEITEPSDALRASLLDLATDPSRSAADAVPETEHVRAGTDDVVRGIAECGTTGERRTWIEPAADPDAEGVAHSVVRSDDHLVHGSVPLGLGSARTATMMTATPVEPVFRQIFEDAGMNLTREETMTAAQKGDYFDEILDADVVQTTRASRFISGGSNARPNKFRHTVERIRERHGEDPLVISSKKALHGPLSREIEEMGLESVNFARAVGTNEYAEEDLAIVWGAPHYGDDYVRRVAAFCGDRDAEPIRDGGDTRWSTGTSQEIYENMCEGTVFQAMLRVSRASDSHSTIYVETDKIPDGVGRLQPEGHDLFRTLTGAEREIVAAAEELGEFRVGELNDLVTPSRRTIYNTLERLRDEGVARVVEEDAEYGADRHEIDLRVEDETVLDETERERLNEYIMEKPHDVILREPDPSASEAVLSTAGDEDPPETGEVEAGEAQLGLRLFGD